MKKLIPFATLIVALAYFFEGCSESPRIDYAATYKGEILGTINGHFYLVAAYRDSTPVLVIMDSMGLKVNQLLFEVLGPREIAITQAHDTALYTTTVNSVWIGRIQAVDPYKEGLNTAMVSYGNKFGDFDNCVTDTQNKVGDLVAYQYFPQIEEKYYFAERIEFPQLK